MTVSISRARVCTGWLLLLPCALLVACGEALAQREFREYEGFEGANSEGDLPPDYDVPRELVIGRLMYDTARGPGCPVASRPWTVDYPRGDRALIEMLKRFTRTEVRTVEQPVSLDDGDDIFYWPFLNVGLGGCWQLSDELAAKLRDYLLRGGFLFSDSFFDSRSWESFSAGLRQVFPDREIVNLTGEEAIFYIVFDLPEMIGVQIPNMTSLLRGGGGWMGDGRVPHWRAVFDDDGRIMVLIAFNNDVSDSWQWADDPRYPVESANLGLRIGVNIVMYSLTH